VTRIEHRLPQLDPSSPILRQLHQLLKKLGYHTAGIAPDFDGLDPSPNGVLPGSPLHSLVRLFFSQEPVEPPALREALKPLSLEQVLEAGFCHIDGEYILTNVLLQPYKDVIFAMGLPSLETRPEDFLMRISSSSLEVAHLMVSRPARNALDLGTGCGFLATLLSKNSERVYAVDVNPIAVQFTEFNARWNGFPNITCLQGSLFEPVRHLRFDLIVSNPPFFIGPLPGSSANHRLFQHSGHEGDSFCIQLARDASTFLEEDGYFQMMFSWFEFRGQDWGDKLAAVFSGLGCDVWGLRICQDSAEDYVSSLCSESDQTELDSFRQEGLRYFEQNNITSVGTGLLTLRRCSTRPNLLWFDEAPDDRSEPYGSAVAAIFDIRARFDSATDDVLLQQIFTAAPGLVSIRKTSLQGCRWQITASELALESGLKYTFGDVDPLILRVVPYLDGCSSLHQVLERVSLEEHLPLGDVIAKRLPSFRELIRFGFLLPRDGSAISLPMANSK